MENKEKIKRILDSVKIEVADFDRFENDIESVLRMFDEIKGVDVEGISASLSRKKVCIDELRVDESFDSRFRVEMRGKYFKVPRKSDVL